MWRWLDDNRNISTGVAAILKLQLCLGARVSEVAGMRADEYATDDKGRLLWTLPAERSKNKRPRVTPVYWGWRRKSCQPAPARVVLFRKANRPDRTIAAR